ncbi:hybrid sensor histidine kinase/response regulator [Roseateles cellulosilyticus]|uniref:histidine kinase n=1 Tax=Pelomonas cellulosilytica TaxID=2906762 RepID=A0ABS8XQ76_9BURK|nr:response regulator [Pelomonas sp. P8]MCE4554899.1 response regulator [Pelomonas sp. P8]
MTDLDALDGGQRSVDRSRHRLLIVNDDPVGRYTTVRQLGAAGFPTLEAATGAEALMLADGALGAIVLDIHLPDIDGFEVCRRLRAQPGTRRVPIVHLTAAFLSDEDKVRGLDAGADAYLTHPVEPAVLVSTIQALVRTRAAEDAMRRSESRFRAVYARAPVGVCLLDSVNGTVLDANPAMLALLRRDAGQVVGRPLADFATPERRAQASAFGAALASAQDSATRELALQDPDGNEIPLEWSTVPDIEPRVCLAMAVDLRPRIELARQRESLLDRERDARSEAERISRMKDELIAVLSHELRTPLNAIMGWAHVLQKRPTPDMLERAAAAIDRNVTVQARMISDILDMSRMNIGKLPLALEPVDLRELIDATVNAVQATFNERNQRLKLELDAIDQPLHADGSRIQQVLWNLLGNAAKFSPAGSEITLRTRDVGGGVAIAVIDQGQGISAEFLPHVFERFTQSDVASNRRHGGLGLGLSIVKHIVELHGGRVSAHSQGTDRGATFEVWLPLQAGSVASDPASPVPPVERESDSHAKSLQNRRVLVVDDDRDAGAMLRLVLGEKGAHAVVVTSVDDALAAVAQQSFDVLISDIGMPGKDGYALMRELRAHAVRARHGQPLKAIALTAFGRPEDRHQSLEAGFDEHFAKPLRPHLLLQALERLLAE